MHKVLLTIFASCISAIVGYSYDFSANGFNFNFTNGDEVELMSASGEVPTRLIIPSEVTYRNKTFKVTTIHSNAFPNANITGLVIQEGITKIGNYAFRFNSFPRLILPNSLESIGEYAFADNNRLSFLQIGKAIPSSNHSRPLIHTFNNCENIDTIVLCTAEPISHINDYPAFSPSVLKFAKVFVPYNSIKKYHDSEWKVLFSENLVPYLPKGEKANLNSYVYLNWDNNKITKSIDISGNYYMSERSFSGDYPSTTENKISIKLSFMPIGGAYLIEADIEKIPQNFFSQNVTRGYPNTYYLLYKGELTNDCLPNVMTFSSEAYHTTFTLTLDFGWLKRSGILKSKFVPGCIVTIKPGDSEPLSGKIYFKEIPDSDSLIKWPEKSND